MWETNDGYGWVVKYTPRFHGDDWLSPYTIYHNGRIETIAVSLWSAKLCIKWRKLKARMNKDKNEPLSYVVYAEADDE